MGLEAATYIHQLNPSNPVGAVDPKAQGDDHIRMIKSALQATFPNITGAMTSTQAQLNAVATVAAPTVKVKATGAAAAGAAVTFVRTDAQMLLDLTDTYAWTGQHSWSVALRIPDGLVGAPGIAFASDTQLGFFKLGANLGCLVAAGAQTLAWDNSAVYVRANRRFYIQDGLVGAPGIAFDNDANCGIYRAAADDIRLVAGGVDGIIVQAAAVFAQLPLNIPNGAAGAGNNAVRFGNDTDTGFYRVSADYMAFEAGGAFVYAIRNIAGAVKIMGADGTAAAPIYTFNSEDTTGLYRISAGVLGFSELGTGYRVGFRNIPRSTTATTLVSADEGRCVAVSAAINIPASVFGAGTSISIYNDSAASINITISAGTLRLAGTTTTGTRALAARGIATLWFNTGGATPEVIASGAGLS